MDGKIVKVSGLEGFTPDNAVVFGNIFIRETVRNRIQDYMLPGLIYSRINPGHEPVLINLGFSSKEGVMRFNPINGVYRLYSVIFSFIKNRTNPHPPFFFLIIYCYKVTFYFKKHYN